MGAKLPSWIEKARSYISSQENLNGYSSVPGEPTTLYGTSFALLALYYLGTNVTPRQEILRFIQQSQVPESGLLIGPELREHVSLIDAKHDLTHLHLHSTCCALPVVDQYNIHLKHEISYTRNFLDIECLQRCLAKVDLSDAWFEGNNLLFIGQLLLDHCNRRSDRCSLEAISALFDWLDQNIDPRTGLWGTDKGSPPHAAVYGGYHQLLLYFHQNRPVLFQERIIDTVLSLQHTDGGFSPLGNSGACEDVDAVDILVNLYKRNSYRRRDIRNALRRVASRILSIQNCDGGFAYAPDQQQSHMGIPYTSAPPDVSTMFPTWFRVHTLALISEVVPECVGVNQGQLRFSSALSMGWHTSPEHWGTHTLHPTPFIDNIYNLVDLLRLRSKHSTRVLLRFIERHLGL